MVPQPRQRHVIAVPLATALGLLLALSTSIALAVGLLQISADPYTNSTSQHQTQLEPDTFSAGSTIVSAFQSGRFFDGGASNIGSSTSTDNGTTWTANFLPGTTPYATPAGIYQRVSDPSVAFDAKHAVWIINFLGLFPNGNLGEVDVLVSRSTDGGLTWGSPVVVNASGRFNDKNWIVCDDKPTSPFYGHCYGEWDDNSRGNLIQMSTSTDGGLSWGPAQSTANSATGIGGQPLVQPGGTVIVPVDNAFEGAVLSFVSTNGGSSWSSTVTVAAIRHHSVAGGLRAPTLPTAEIDKAGKVYVVWSDCRFEAGCSANDLVMSHSIDGLTWTRVKRIPADPVGSGVDHFIPGLAVDKSTRGTTAHLILAYYYYPKANCSQSTCQLDVGYVSSTDGSRTWTANAQLEGPMSLSWLANTNQGRMVGDYISSSFAGGRAYPVFANASAPTGLTFHEAMFTVVGGVTIGDGNLFASGDGVVVSSQPTAPSAPTTQQ